MWPTKVWKALHLYSLALSAVSKFCKCATHTLWVDLACLLLHVVLLQLLCFSANHTGKLLLVQASCTCIDTGFRACTLCNNIIPSQWWRWRQRRWQGHSWWLNEHDEEDIGKRQGSHSKDFDEQDNLHNDRKGSWALGLIYLEGHWPPWPFGWHVIHLTNIPSTSPQSWRCDWQQR